MYHFAKWESFKEAGSRYRSCDQTICWVKRIPTIPLWNGTPAQRTQARADEYKGKEKQTPTDLRSNSKATQIPTTSETMFGWFTSSFHVSVHFKNLIENGIFHNAINDLHVIIAFVLVSLYLRLLRAILRWNRNGRAKDKTWRWIWRKKRTCRSIVYIKSFILSSL